MRLFIRKTSQTVMRFGGDATIDSVRVFHDVPEGDDEGLFFVTVLCQPSAIKGSVAELELKMSREEAKTLYRALQHALMGAGA